MPLLHLTARGRLLPRAHLHFFLPFCLLHTSPCSQRSALFFFSLGRSAVPPLPLEYFQSYLQDRIPFMFQEAGSKTSVLLTTKNPHRSPAWRYRLLSPPALPVPVLGWEPGMRNPTCLTFPRRNTYLALSFWSSPRSSTSSTSFQLSPAASC